MAQQQPFTVNNLAKLLDVSRWTLRRLANTDPTFPPPAFIGGASQVHKYYHVEPVRKYLKRAGVL